MKTDLEIAQQAHIEPITKIARRLGIKENYLEVYGRYKAKVSPEVLEGIGRRHNAKYIVVTAITPTPLGEGKTVTSIGLSMALNRLRKKSIVCLRQPSLGPVFGIKGGAAGGGLSQVLPMEDFNLHFTGDAHAVGFAHNLGAAFLDNHIFHGNMLGIDLNNIVWRRVIDISDRSLRSIRIGMGTKKDGVVRDSGFDITAASEVMAILALASGIQDLKKRLKKIVVAYTQSGRPITTGDLRVPGSMAVLLKDAIKPNLIQTLDNTPCFVHAGPFGNIAHGNNSILADKIAIKLCDYLVTESGFGADCGVEKFVNIKCRYSGLKPDCAVMVVSLRSLKAHSMEAGLANLRKQIENVKVFGIPVVVAINEFETDAPKEIEMIKSQAISFGAHSSCVSRCWAQGAKGGEEMAKAVIAACCQPSNFKFLYPLEIPIERKIEAIATQIYGARAVEFSAMAVERMVKFSSLGFDRLPVCMAKTQFSLSHDPKLKGAPAGYVFPVRDMGVCAGAGFLTAFCGEISTMPGLPSEPAGERIDIDEQGRVTGLF
ncbi:MAG: formate--tetrahydrofolate ligase [Candidatus Omnitrophota bacterium]